ncbi:MAG: hypothetical protein IKA57_02180 [Clostridia bacterium]|jgi:hypothetical protein|nr:hypothetical protein [Clostridia bacterium]
MRNIYDFWQVLTTETIPLAAILVWTGVFLAFCVGLWLLFALLSAYRRKGEEKRRRAEVERRLQYTLPQKDNEYIRERLQNGLKVEEMDVEMKKIHVRLGYARVLLGKVKAAPLTIAERLQTDEMMKVFTLYQGKEEWSVEEVRSLNELCAQLLKLSAKYAV